MRRNNVSPALGRAFLFKTHLMSKSTKKPQSTSKTAHKKTGRTLEAFFPDGDHTFMEEGEGCIKIDIMTAGPGVPSFRFVYGNGYATTTIGVPFIFTERLNS
jgi:hypothetical protein